MIPLRDCSSLQLAILSAQKMGWEERKDDGHIYENGFIVVPEAEEQVGDTRFRAEGCLLVKGGFWNPAEDPADALRLVSVLATRDVSVVLECCVGSRRGVLTYTDMARGRKLEARKGATPEVWCSLMCRALTESCLSALGVQGWEEPQTTIETKEVCS